jgi:hypothetical protein
MADIIVSLTKKGREREAQALLYGYGYRVDFFVIGSGGHDPGNPTLALPLDENVTELPGLFFGPEPIDRSELISSTCPRWLCILQPGEAVGQISNIGLIATVVFIPSASLLLTPSDVFPGSSDKNFSPGNVFVNPSNTISIAIHGFVDGDKVVFTTTNALPAGLNNTTEYFIITSTPGTFQVSLSSGGPAVLITTPGVGTHTVRLASDDTFTKIGHGLIDGNAISVITTDTLPGGLISVQTYFAIRTTPNTFKLSGTLAGPPINISSAGVGVLTVTNLDSITVGAPEVGSTFLYAQANLPARFKLSASRESYIISLQT